MQNWLHFAIIALKLAIPRLFSTFNIQIICRYVSVPLINGAVIFITVVVLSPFQIFWEGLFECMEGRNENLMIKIIWVALVVLCILVGWYGITHLPV